MNTEQLGEMILLELQLELRWMPEINLEEVAIMVTVEAGVAILHGSVTHSSIRRLAEKAARRVLGIRSVLNQIILEHPSIEVAQVQILEGSTMNSHPDTSRSPRLIGAEAT